MATKKSTEGIESGLQLVFYGFVTIEKVFAFGDCFLLWFYVWIARRIKFWELPRSWDDNSYKSTLQRF
jgi:hypothetical protein